MAESQIQDLPTAVSQKSEMNDLKKDLESYRELLIPLTKMLEWEEAHYPAILVGVITLLFAIVWYIEPSVLTGFSLLGVAICLFDFVVPFVGPQLFRSAEWTVVQERQFESICERVLNAKRHVCDVKDSLCKLKLEKPKVYLLVMMGAFILLAWIGCLIDNLLLLYLLVVFLILLPGLRKHGIIQRYSSQLIAKFKQMIQGAKEKGTKTKTN